MCAERALLYCSICGEEPATKVISSESLSQQVQQNLKNGFVLKKSRMLNPEVNQ
jgi:hypothetical protein